MLDSSDDIDDIDRALITALQDDGRRGYAELGTLVGLTAGGARKRVKRLEDRGIIQIVGVTNPLSLGYQSMAMVGIVAGGDPAEVARKVNELDSVIYAVLTAGRYDLLVEVIAVDQAHMFDVINHTLRGIDGVSEIETFTYYSITTHRFGWGTI